MTEMTHEHDWSAWAMDGAGTARDGIVREARWCLEWACDSTEIRPAPDARTVAAAQALYARDNYGNGLRWDDQPELLQHRYYVDARRILAAGEGACSPAAEVEPHNDTAEPDKNEVT